MTLSEIRELFVELSGREDLLQNDSVVSADLYINEGSKELDRRLFGGKTLASYTTDIAAGQILVFIPNCRLIKEVWLFTPTDKVQLTKADSLVEMKTYYSEPKSGLTPSEPFVYYPISGRHYPSTVPTVTPGGAVDLSQIWAVEDLITSSSEGYSAIIISPVPDLATYTIRVEGAFYSDALTDGDDVNYWSINHPLTLVKAALYKMEQTYRNTEGAKDYDAAITGVLTQLNSDWIEEEIADIDQMEG